MKARFNKPMPLNSERLRLLRQFQELTQTELAERVAVSQPTIADYEAGRKEPQSEVAQALAITLKVDHRFLFQSDDDHFSESEYNFRKRAQTSEKLKKKVAAQAALFGIIVRELKKHVPTMPKLNIPSLPAATDDEIEESAEKARIHWGLEVDGPINSMVDVLESAGVLLTVADAETAERVDAFSRYGPTSVVVLNTAKGSSSRTFFDTAHEAAHGVLHHGQPAKALDVREAEAQRFAGSFLMPKRPFTRDYWSRGGVDFTNLLEMKASWGTSLSAILVRAFQLGLIDAVVYRSAFRELAGRGWRVAEPEEPAPEFPKLFMLGLEQYEKNTKRTVKAFIEDTLLTPQLFTAVSGYVPAPAKNSGVVSLAEHREGVKSRTLLLDRQN
jgi:Zn-dependent peptidase ImmA (M78 family)/transcriptional regulator with XRE-family HTH domain